jgi:predicted RNA-binding Zn-ribbon protein involved in translation (DUF1610 family)
MRLLSTDEKEPGSLSVVYSCPECGYEMAMLTNAQETQMVRSLGVRIGPAAAAAIAAPGGGVEGTPAVAASGKCPFSAMLPAKDAAQVGPSWTPEALARLDAIPEMVRPMARAGIEMVAKESGHQVIDEAVLTAARTRFGM